MTNQSTRRALIRGAAITPLVLLTAGCAVLPGPERVTLSQAEIEVLMRRRFPLDRRLLEVLDVRLTDPTVKLLPERNRLVSNFSLAVGDRLFGNQWKGSIALDSELQWSSADGTLRLKDVRVDTFRLDPAGRAAADRPSQGERIAALLAERVLEDQVLYQLSPEREASLQRAGLVPDAVKVTSSGVEVTFRGKGR